MCVSGLLAGAGLLHPVWVLPHPLQAYWRQGQQQTCDPALYMASPCLSWPKSSRHECAHRASIHGAHISSAAAAAVGVQVDELAAALSSSRSALEAAEGEATKAKELHQQVKGALQLAYSQNQELAKQVRVLGC